MSDEIAFNRPKTVRVGMYELNCDSVNKELCRRAGALVDRLLKFIQQQSTAANKEICLQFQDAAAKALTKPTSTEHLMELKVQVEKFKAESLSRLEAEVVQCRARLDFLMDNSSLTTAEIELNSETFTWPTRFEPILTEHMLLIRTSRQEGEESLRTRRTRFNEELEALLAQVQTFRDCNELEMVPRYFKKATSLMEALEAGVATIENFNKEEEAFEWEVTQYPLRNKLVQDLDPYVKLFAAVTAFTDQSRAWLEGSVSNIHPETVENEVSTIWRTLYKLEKSFGDQPGPCSIARAVKVEVDEFKQHLPLVQSLCNQGLRDRHWEQLSTIVGFQLKPDAGTSLAKILGMHLEQYLDQFEVISESATKEFSLEKALSKMKGEWQDMEFNAIPYRESGTSILSSVDEIQQLLDDQVVKTQTMLGSPFVKAFEEEMREWNTTLVTLQDVLDVWLKVQATWLYLEPIFSSPDIMAQMPDEGRRFTQVDKTWRDTMKETVRDRHVLAVAKIDKLLDRLQKSDELLELILKVRGRRSFLSGFLIHFSFPLQFAFLFLSNFHYYYYYFSLVHSPN
jgi:dynein heavy chain